MNNQKDTQKTIINTSPLGSSLDHFGAENPLDSSIYEFANKKTEKLVTALYLVSDCMDTDDALKGKLRLLGVELLSDIYKLSTLSPIEKHSYISVSLTHIYELLSFIEISHTIGFISEMNTMILKKEFSILISLLKSNQEKDKHFTFTLDEKMFSTRGESSARKVLAENSYIKDKRTNYNNMSFMNNKSPLERKDRTDKILSIIKEKKEVSIKDISLAFTDCSEKTIQRELNLLVLNGQLKKTGSKRWSRYAVI